MTSALRTPHRQPHLAGSIFAAEDCPRRLAWLAAAVQDRCCYCGCETWLPWHAARRIRICERLGIPIDGPQAKRVFLWRMATIEHLTRRADGGGDEASNLALACEWCNPSRHDLPAGVWAIVVAGVVAVGRHPCVSRTRAAERLTNARAG